MTTFHGDLRETREILSPLLAAPPQSASSRPRAEHATPRARRASPSDAPPRASCGSPLHQASKAAAPEGVQAPPPQGCIAPRRSPHARLPHERKQCVPPRDAKGRRPRPRRQLPYRVSSGEDLYNEARPHSKLGWMTPEAYAGTISGESGRRAAQPDGSAPASCNTRRPRLRSTQDSRYGWMKNCPRGEGSRPGGCRWDRVPAREAGRTARLPSPTGEGLGVRVQRLAPPDLCGHKAAPSGSVTAPGSIRAC
jgi:hypothetical protein